MEMPYPLVCIWHEFEWVSTRKLFKKEQRTIYEVLRSILT